MGAFDQIIASIMSPGQGTDPNTGDMLMDRFHQARATQNPMRSGEDDNRGGPQAAQLDQLAVQLVQSRGAPLTPQNVQMARAYMQGGAMPMFDAQQQQQPPQSQGVNAPSGNPQNPVPQSRPMPRQSTSSDIADQAVAADGGGSEIENTDNIVNDKEVQKAPKQDAGENADGGAGGYGNVIFPAAAAGAAGTAVATQQGAGANSRGTVPMEGGGAVDQTSRVTGVNPARTDNAVEGRSGRNAPRQLPPPATPEPAMPQPDIGGGGSGGASRIGADVIDAESVPIDMQEQINAPRATQNVGSGSIVGPDGAPYTYDIIDGGDRFMAKAPSGEMVEAATKRMLRQALQAAF